MFRYPDNVEGRCCRFVDPQTPVEPGRLVSASAYEGSGYFAAVAIIHAYEGGTTMLVAASLVPHHRSTTMLR